MWHGGVVGWRCTDRTLQTCVWYGGRRDPEAGKDQHEAVVSTRRTGELRAAAEPYHRSPVRRRARSPAHLHVSPAWRHRWRRRAASVYAVLLSSVRRLGVDVEAKAMLRLGKEEEEVARDDDFAVSALFFGVVREWWAKLTEQLLAFSSSENTFYLQV